MMHNSGIYTIFVTFTKNILHNRADTRSAPISVALLQEEAAV